MIYKAVDIRLLSVQTTHNIFCILHLLFHEAYRLSYFIYFSLYLSLFLFVCPFVRLMACLTIWLSDYTSVCSLGLLKMTSVFKSLVPARFNFCIYGCSDALKVNLEKKILRKKIPINCSFLSLLCFVFSRKTNMHMPYKPFFSSFAFRWDVVIVQNATRAFLNKAC